LTVRPDGLVSGAEYVDADGVEHSVRAGVTILCANGIGTPRLLLLSDLGNSSGLVGKRLMMHPFGTVVGVFEEDFRAWQGPWGQFIHSLEFYETDPDRGFVRGAKWGLQPTGGPFSMTSAYPWGAENAPCGRGSGIRPCGA
jgi:choline dehydrogenase-like flavoprotein